MGKFRFHKKYSATATGPKRLAGLTSSIELTCQIFGTLLESDWNTIYWFSKVRESRPNFASMQWSKKDWDWERISKLSPLLFVPSRFIFFFCIQPYSCAEREWKAWKRVPFLSPFLFRWWSAHRLFLKELESFFSNALYMELNTSVHSILYPLLILVTCSIHHNSVKFVGLGNEVG